MYTYVKCEEVCIVGKFQNCYALWFFLKIFPWIAVESNGSTYAPTPLNYALATFSMIVPAFFQLNVSILSYGMF